MACQGHAIPHQRNDNRQDRRQLRAQQEKSLLLERRASLEWSERAKQREEPQEDAGLNAKRTNGVVGIVGEGIDG